MFTIPDAHSTIKDFSMMLEEKEFENLKRNTNFVKSFYSRSEQDKHKILNQYYN